MNVSHVFRRRRLPTFLMSDVLNEVCSILSKFPGSSIQRGREAASSHGTEPDYSGVEQVSQIII